MLLQKESSYYLFMGLESLEQSSKVRPEPYDRFCLHTLLRAVWMMDSRTETNYIEFWIMSTYDATFKTTMHAIDLHLRAEGLTIDRE